MQAGIEAEMEKMDKELKSLPTIFDFHTEVSLHLWHVLLQISITFITVVLDCSCCAGCERETTQRRCSDRSCC